MHGVASVGLENVIATPLTNMLNQLLSVEHGVFFKNLTFLRKFMPSTFQNVENFCLVSILPVLSKVS